MNEVHKLTIDGSEVSSSLDSEALTNFVRAELQAEITRQRCYYQALHDVINNLLTEHAERSKERYLKVMEEFIRSYQKVH